MYFNPYHMQQQQTLQQNLKNETKQQSSIDNASLSISKVYSQQTTAISPNSFNSPRRRWTFRPLPVLYAQPSNSHLCGSETTGPKTASKTQMNWSKRNSAHFQAVLESRQLFHSKHVSYEDGNTNSTEGKGCKSASPGKSRFLDSQQKRRINYQKGGGGGAYKRKLVLGSAQSPDLYSGPTSQYVGGSEKEGITKSETIPGASEKGINEFVLEGGICTTNDKRTSKDSAWQKIMKDGDFHINSGNNNDSRSLSNSPNNNKKPQQKEKEGTYKLSDAININSIDLKGKNPDIDRYQPSNPMHEMKKQILKELMEINSIPASYFLLGKEAARCRLDIGIDDVAGLVDISTNEEGDIVIRPNEASIAAQYSKSKRARLAVEPEPGSCKNAVMIRRVQMSQKPVTESPRRKILTADIPLRNSQRKRLTPIKRPEPIKRDITLHLHATSNSTTIGKIGANTSPENKKPVALQPKSNPPRLVPAPIKEASKPKKTEIKIWHEPDNHLHGHHINVTFRLINDLLALCGKLKLENTNDKQQQFLTLGKKLGLGFTKKQIGNPDFFKSKENLVYVKDKLLHVLYTTLNKDDEFIYEPIKSAKYFVGNGNNPMMVKSILKQRWWWTLADSMDTANLVWTQWKKPKIINLLSMTKPALVPKDELTVSTSISTDVGLDTDFKDTKKKSVLNSSNNAKIGESPKNTFLRLCNHLEGNGHLGNKKAMFYNMKIFYESIGKDPFDAMPLTFHIKEGKGDKEYSKFLEAYHALEGQHMENVWIIKPGENSNRGRGILLAKTLAEVEKIMAEPTIKGEKHTYILQKYIERPLLFNKRKFDIRCFGLLTAINGHVKGYFYKEGYLRTASKDFSLKSLGSKIVHLTNEAVQKKYDEFGKFEPGNKLTYADFQRYLEAAYPDVSVNFFTDLLPQIKKLVIDSFRATHGKLDPMGRQHTFELFGYDFMIDSDFHVYLIEANINPCLEIMSPVTARIVPAMVDNALRIAVDPIFQPPSDLSSTKKTMGEVFPEIKHELVYDSKVDGAELQELKENAENVIVEVEDEENDDSGDEVIENQVEFELTLHLHRLTFQILL
eukprot:TRINITY_DN337_c0_g1_i1.p1 TRINITY_DN337_c0_g1~~TRINITY_DN337_c0_g1_i1.p1  ORF type:complete len:1075 (+),score=98.46 TRINITY_DN337_c0_g1_i1:2250-5474(+)